MMIRKHIISLLAVFALLSCSKAVPAPDTFDHNYDGMDRIACVVDTATVLFNPERGFYKNRDVSASSNAIQTAPLVTARMNNQSLTYVGFYLSDFYHSDISEAYLKKISDTFTHLREAGLKCILRFAYTASESAEEKDAPKEWVLRHLEQLTPLLQENSDVIFVMQAGLIGVWGEGAFTTYYPRPDSLAARKELLLATLKALPKDRQVCLRTPYYKKEIFGLSDADTLTAATAHNGSDISRVAGHNDCFLASNDDYGTYVTKGDRAFWMADTRYTAMCGEMCILHSKLCKCDNSMAMVSAYHWSALNMQHTAKFYKNWEEDAACGEWIENHLGYRLSLEDAYFQKDPVAGQDYRLVLKVRNSGVSAPVNYRYPEIVFVDSKGAKTVFPFPKTNLQEWYENTLNVLDYTVKLPAAGEYKVYLNLPDPYASIHDNPYYSIRLANVDTWDETTGYNYLTTITVQ